MKKTLFILLMFILNSSTDHVSNGDEKEERKLILKK